MGVSEIGFPQNVVYRTRIQTSDTLPVTIGASKYCEFLFDIDAGDRMTPLGIVGWGCNDKTQVFLLDFYMDNDLQTAKLILKNPYATTIAITSLYIDVIYSKQALDMSEVDVVDNLTTDSAVAALSARQGKLLDEKIDTKKSEVETYTRGYSIKNESITGDFNASNQDSYNTPCVTSVYVSSSHPSGLTSQWCVLIVGGSTTHMEQMLISVGGFARRRYEGGSWNSWITKYWRA